MGSQTRCRISCLIILPVPRLVIYYYWRISPPWSCSQHPGCQLVWMCGTRSCLASKSRSWCADSIYCSSSNLVALTVLLCYRSALMTIGYLTYPSGCGCPRYKPQCCISGQPENWTIAAIRSLPSWMRMRSSRIPTWRRCLRWSCRYSSRHGRWQDKRL